MLRELTSFAFSVSETLHLQDKLYSLLSTEEQQRAQRLRNQQKQQQFIATRATLRLLLAQHMSVAANKLRIGYSAAKKPLLYAMQHALHFNVSHSFDYALLALSDQAVGVDIEYKHQSLNSTHISAVFHPKEQHTKTPLLVRWIRKEAWAKLHGDWVYRDWPTWYVPATACHTSIAVHPDYLAIGMQHQQNKHQHYALSPEHIQSLLE